MRAGLSAADVDLPVGDALRRLDRLEVPGAVAAVPLILGLDLEQLVAKARLCERRPVGRCDHHVEGRVLAFAERAAREQGLDADHRRGRDHRQRQLAFDRAATGLGHAHDHLRRERTRGRRLLLERHSETRFAVLVGIRQAFERLAGGFHLLVGESELVAGKARPLGRGRNRDLAFELKPRGRRAVKVMSVDGDLGRARAGQALGLGGELEFEPVGDIVLDQEGRLAHRRAFRIGEGAHAPGAGRRG